MAAVVWTRNRVKLTQGRDFVQSVQNVPLSSRLTNRQTAARVLFALGAGAGGGVRFGSVAPPLSLHGDPIVYIRVPCTF